jgi:RNA polymerase sigma-70 factor (ECF subfamily)
VERLATRFLAAGGKSSGTEITELENRLEALLARGRLAHPGIHVTAEHFVEHLGRCGARVGDGQRDLHAEDLYLACACLAGDKPALAQLRTIGEPVVEHALKRMGGSGSVLEEIGQQLWEALLLGRGKAAKLATFAGRGPIVAWIGISTKRLAFNLLRREQIERRVRQEAAASHRIASADPELVAFKDRYRAQFQKAIDAAIEALDDRDKMLFRLHLIDGATLERIAGIYRVTHPTIVRWLEKARQRVLVEAKRRLREMVSLDSAEFDSIGRLLVSQLDLDISRVLTKAR